MPLASTQLLEDRPSRSLQRPADWRGLGDGAEQQQRRRILAVTSFVKHIAIANLFSFGASTEICSLEIVSVVAGDFTLRSLDF